ncbi:unnamed protein product [Ambrosiozyma monospora]|uniref:Unnamed protein product n=1 Tax=Ambrosiozyma monospora TaxID=43982 RepID=A0ACB5T5F7_AMBMO|nr:unnamed protein product [Ambrosiozyma monospora]
MKERDKETYDELTQLSQTWGSSTFGLFPSMNHEIALNPRMKAKFEKHARTGDRVRTNNIPFFTTLHQFSIREITTTNRAIGFIVSRHIRQITSCDSVFVAVCVRVLRTFVSDADLASSGLGFSLSFAFAFFDFDFDFSLLGAVFDGNLAGSGLGFSLGFGFDFRFLNVSRLENEGAKIVAWFSNLGILMIVLRDA